MKIWKKDILIILNNEFKEDPITSTEIDAIHCLPSHENLIFKTRMENGRLKIKI